MPFAADSFEGVLCMNALHHLPSYAAALREIHRVLKPGGRAVFSEPGTAHAAQPLSRFRMREESVIEKSVSLPSSAAWRWRPASAGCAWCRCGPRPPTCSTTRRRRPTACRCSRCGTRRCVSARRACPFRSAQRRRSACGHAPAGAPTRGTARGADCSRARVTGRRIGRGSSRIDCASPTRAASRGRRGGGVSADR